jgi:cytochrome c biogenesis protein CcdA
MFTLLSLGFLIGLAHAFEADHVAAVSALVSGRSNPRQMVRLGALWGLGHTLTLFLVGGTVLLAGTAVPEVVSTGLEGMVGLMLIGLGAHVLWRLHRDRVHFHRHRHTDGHEHLHLHSHRDEAGPHNARRHAHAHPDPAALRTLAVGMMHGLAGSAALVLVTAAAMTSALTGLTYIALFGLGSILGMATVTAAIALPLSWTAGAMTRVNGAVQLLIGTLTIGIGALTLVDSATVFLG